MQESTIILTDCICADGLGSSTDPVTRRPFGVTDPGTSLSTDPGTSSSTDPGTRSFFDPGLLAGVVVVVVVLLLAAVCIVVPIIYIWWR